MTGVSSEQLVQRDTQPWVSAVTRDAIRHFAWGVGDNNPLWTDVDYAKSSRWSGFIAPPCFLYAVDETTVAPGYPGHRRIYRSVDWTFYDVAPVDRELNATASYLGESELEEGIEQFGRVEFGIADERLIAVAETKCLRTLSPSISTDDRPELRYSGEQLEEIERTILTEERRGNVSRVFETVSQGDTLGTLIKGPLSIMDVVAWSAATSGVVTPEMTHSEGGLQAETATGPELVSWISQAVTDWMGDDSFLHRLQIDVRECPELGATTTITGRVCTTQMTQGQPSVCIDLVAMSQSEDIIGEGRAIVLLPSEEKGPVHLPIPPEHMKDGA